MIPKKILLENISSDTDFGKILGLKKGTVDKTEIDFGIDEIYDFDDEHTYLSSKSLMYSVLNSISVISKVPFLIARFFPKSDTGLDCSTLIFFRFIVINTKKLLISEV